LVKELRQGMRARSFEWAFVVVQMLMVLAMVVALSAAARNEHDVSRVFGEGIFWAMVAIPVLLVMPMRGATALRTEVQIGALELIFLTRLSAWRIVAGKWGALFAQTCLLLCAILPYAVLRYYLGSVDLVQDLLVILLLLAASGLFTALTVSVSAFPSKAARAMVIIFPLVIINLAPAMVMAVSVGPVRGGVSFAPGASPWAGLAVFGFYVLLLLAYLLEIGAARIAPPAENHAIRKRLLGLVLVISGPVAILLGSDNAILLVNLALLAPVCLDALCANPDPLPGQFRPFLRWPRLGTAASWFLMPGWPTGVLYTLLVLGLSLAGLAARGMAKDEVLLAWAALGGALLLPVALVLLVLPKAQRMGPAYMVFQLVFVIGTALFLILNNLFDWEQEKLVLLCPVSTLVMTLAEKSETFWIVPAGGIFALVVAVILVVGRPAYLRHSAMREAARRIGPGGVRPADAERAAP
jgi:membrane protein YdbS with pleckstrin-like domain